MNLFFLLLFISSCCREVAWLQALHICGSLLTCPLVWCSAGTDGWWVGWWGLVVVVVVVVSICDILYTNISRQIHCPVINLFYSEPSTTQCPGDLNNNNEKRKIKKMKAKITCPLLYLNILKPLRWLQNSLLQNSLFIVFFFLGFLSALLLKI